MTEAFQISAKSGVSKERQLADLALDPVFGGAIIASTFGKNVCGETISPRSTSRFTIARRQFGTTSSAARRYAHGTGCCAERDVLRTRPQIRREHG
jgi:hypothetical protein